MRVVARTRHGKAPAHIDREVKVGFARYVVIVDIADDIEDSRHGRLHAVPLNRFLSRPAAPVTRLCSLCRCAGRSRNSTTTTLIGADHFSDFTVGRRRVGRTGIGAVRLHTRIWQGGVRGRPNNMPVGSPTRTRAPPAPARQDKTFHVLQNIRMSTICRSAAFGSSCCSAAPCLGAPLGGLRVDPEQKSKAHKT